jgi:hypothetical protein
LTALWQLSDSSLTALSRLCNGSATALCRISQPTAPQQLSNGSAITAI